LFWKKSSGVADEHIELRSIVKSLALIEWLVLILVLLYYLAPGSVVLYPAGMVGSMVVFALYAIVARLFDRNGSDNRRKAAISSWVMIVFITWIIWNTGGVLSPLFTLYLLVIIISAITLGKVITILEIVAMVAAFLLVALEQSNEFSLREFSRLMLFFSPFVLVAWVTTQLAADIQAGSTMFKSMAHTDEMTGLLNKRSLRQELERAMHNALQRSQPLTVMMLDADNLKQINDQYGHEAGDRLIQHIASVLRSSLRSSDSVCRYGGDEFVAVLPQMALSKAAEIGELIRQKVAQNAFQSGEQLLKTSVSIGFATWPDHTKDITQLMVLADESLYECKRKGRNQVTHYGELAAAPRTGD